MSERRFLPEQGQSVNAVNGFVTKVWEHPLVTDLTRTKRRNAVAAAHKILTDVGAERALLVPVGGALWVSTPYSDVDFVLLHEPGMSADSITAIRSSLHENYPLAIRDPQKPILNQADKHAFEKRLQQENDGAYLALLFLTPDEYIAGDANFLRQLRLRAVDQTAYEPSVNTENFFPQRFKEEIGFQLFHIKDWPMAFFGHPNDTHYPRWSDALRTRAEKSHDSHRWERAFYQAFTEFMPPSFQTFSRAMQTTGGQIHLDRRFMAQGI